jgi:hypothetical protein
MIMRQSAASAPSVNVAFPFSVLSHFHDICGAPISTGVDICAVSVHSVPSRAPNFCNLVELPIAAVLRRPELSPGPEFRVPTQWGMMEPGIESEYVK